MRIHYTKACARVVEGNEDSLSVSGRLSQSVTPEIDQQLKELPREVMRMFNLANAPEGQTIDYASDPIVYMPDKFSFVVDVESLGRLARESLLQMIPLDAATWETKYVPIADLYVGGEGELLDQRDQDDLKRAIREAQSKPVRGKVFVFSGSLPAQERRLAEHATRTAGGLVDAEVTDSCDYYVTDRENEIAAAQRAGARSAIDSLTHKVMLMKPV
jgi:NAD-dependent DNA ligase